MEVFDSILPSPVECLLPGPVVFRRQRKGGRAKPQHVHQPRLIVPLVSITNETVLRGTTVDDRHVFYGFGRPTVCVTRNGVERPLPIGAAKQRVGDFADFTLGGRVSVKKCRRREHSREQKRAVNRGKLALPGTTTVFHFQKVIVETLVARHVRLGSLWAVVKESQRGQNAFGRVRSFEPTISHRDRMTTQSQPGGRNTARRTFVCVVLYKSVLAIRMVYKIAECQSLELNDIVGQFRHVDLPLSRRVRSYPPLSIMILRLCK